MPDLIHRTRILKSAEGQNARIALVTSSDGKNVKTSITTRRMARGLVSVSVSQVENGTGRTPITQNLAFVINRAGLQHLCSVETA